MNRKTLIGFGMVLAAVAICLFVTQNVLAQPKPEVKPEAKKPEAKKPEPPKTEVKKEEPKKPEAKPEMKTDAGKEMTVAGKLMDLHCFMMGAKEEPAKTGECLKAGAPAILDTGKDIYILSKGPKGTDLAAMAGQDVEVKGKVFEKAGIKYLDFTAIAKKGGEAKKPEPPKMEPKKEDVKKPEPPKAEPKKEEPKKPEPPKTK
jgi:hypothetical protein